MNIEKSVGAVIKYQSPSSKMKDPQFLLLRNRRGYWGFPQGHKEEGETEIQTLFREVYEETGINYLNILSFIGRIRYSFFKGEGVKSRKEVSFYYATTSIRDITLSNEHDDFIWTTFSESLTYLNRKQLRSIMIEGHEKGFY
ncbi:MAG TPA: NUDIX domain-containing protein [Nitrososphaeraceae archaeon]|nr:NUDIX domain-containing protein [Nitrososphaeraceae archaeon]